VKQSLFSQKKLSLLQNSATNGIAPNKQSMPQKVFIISRHNQQGVILTRSLVELVQKFLGE